MEHKNKLLIICGPTGTGKTALGINLAKKFNGEIISADSRQVYRGMDIGTGKDLPAAKRFHLLEGGTLTKNDKLQIGYYLMGGIRVWLYDIVKPDYQFSVADYVKCANLAIEDIYKRGKLPIIVGGTGLYIKALIDGIGTLGIKPNYELRKRLFNCSIAQLLDQLKKLDKQKWESLNNSDRNNSRRLIRAIEIAREKKKNSVRNGFWTHSTSSVQASQNDDDLLIVGLIADSKNLYQRIDERVEQRVKQGMEKEIKELLLKGYTFENSAMGTTTGYKQSFSLNKDLPDIQKWKFAEHAYARRQMTWFKKEKRIHWFELTQKDFVCEIEKLVEGWYNRN